MEKFEWNDIYAGTTADYLEPDAQLLSIALGLKAGRALDVGCGAGGFAVALAQRGWQVLGVDLAPNAIAAARAVAAQRGVQAQFEVGDASSWRPPDQGTYDLVVSSLALPDTRALREPAFAMMREALGPGGRIIIKDFDAAMARFSEFSGFELITLAELNQAFAGLDILRSEIVETPRHPKATGEGSWTAALFHAQRPGG